MQAGPEFKSLVSVVNKGSTAGNPGIKESGKCGTCKRAVQENRENVIPDVSELRLSL